MRYKAQDRIGAKTLKTAFELQCRCPQAEEAEIALKAAAPQIGRAAAVLQEREAERRAVRRQAWALAGCSLLFAALVYLGYLNRAFLLAKSERWGPAVGFAALGLILVACLPLLLQRREREE